MSPSTGSFPDNGAHDNEVRDVVAVGGVPEESRVAIRCALAVPRPCGDYCAEADDRPDQRR